MMHTLRRPARGGYVPFAVQQHLFLKTWLEV
jgi:hypothetical protein